MVIKPDTRIKIRNFFKKYGKLIAVIAFIWISIIIINNFVGKRKNYDIPKTTYKPQISVIDSSSSAPTKVQKSMEEFVEEYVEYCNNHEFEKAYNMISDDCKENYFQNYSYFENYVKNKFDTKKIYSIQNYSNYEKKYIYDVKICDDVLATGLTDQTFMYQDEKIVASYDENNNIVFSVGNFIEKQDLKSVQENDYLKVDVQSKLVEYSKEIYQVKFSNRSNKEIVIKNGLESSEVLLNVNGDYRTGSSSNIVIHPYSTVTYSISFPKFYDDGKNVNSILLDSIRVFDNYSEENYDSDNAIYKFSMELGF